MSNHSRPVYEHVQKLFSTAQGQLRDVGRYGLQPAFLGPDNHRWDIIASQDQFQREDPVIDLAARSGMLAEESQRLLPHHFVAHTISDTRPSITLTTGYRLVPSDIFPNDTSGDYLLTYDNPQARSRRKNVNDAVVQSFLNCTPDHLMYFTNTYDREVAAKNHASLSKGLHHLKNEGSHAAHDGSKFVFPIGQGLVAVLQGSTSRTREMVSVSILDGNNTLRRPNQNLVLASLSLREIQQGTTVTCGLTYESLNGSTHPSHYNRERRYLTGAQEANFLGQVASKLCLADSHQYRRLSRTEVVHASQHTLLKDSASPSTSIDLAPLGVHMSNS